MFDSRIAPSLRIGNCPKFEESWKKLNNFIPQGPAGNGVTPVNPPYGHTPVVTPPIPYQPPTVSLARPRWEGWRYGSNYVNSDGKERVCWASNIQAK